MKKVLFIVLAGVLFNSCATHPADIPPAMVPTAEYEEMSCTVLTATHAEQTQLLSDLSRSQRSSRNWDIALNILVIPGLGALTGDVETDIANVKGALVAIRNEMTKRC